MANAGKKPTDITLEDMTGPGVIAADLPLHDMQAPDGTVGALAVPAGIGVKYEFPVKKRIKDAVDGMMDQPVPDRGLAYASRLGVGNVKIDVTAVLVRLVGQITAET
jgi:hypothetical protein